MNIRVLKKLEFYITNVCNLTCEGCNRYNNLSFKGTQKWADYSELYESWSKLIDVEKKVILGGEPLLNPTLLDWISGLHKLWPKYDTQILTNGTYLDKVEGLRETCKSNNTWIGISKHRSDNIEFLESKIEKYLGGIAYKTITDTDHGKEYYYKNKGCKVYMWDQFYFYQNNLIPQQNLRYTLPNNDPTKAHACCPHVNNKNYHFSKAKLFKCATVDLLPTLDKQIQLDINDDDRELLNQYQPLTIDNFEDYQETFFNTLDNVIPQCKFCPEKYNYQQIYATNK